MLRIEICNSHGDAAALETRGGITLMEALRENDVEGIDADCGGCCACATCHVHVDPAWREAVGAPGPLEVEMLDLVAQRRDGSRLSCQIRLSPTLDGLSVAIPAAGA